MELNSAELIARVRKLTNDVTAPYFQSDAELLDYLSAAQREFAGATHTLRLSKQFTTKADQSYVSAASLSIDFVREVLDAWHLGASGEKKRLGIFGKIPPEAQNEEAGPPSAIVVSLADNKFDVIPTPDAVYHIQLDFYGLPSDDIADGGVPEIPTRFQVFLPFGAAVLALASAPEEHYDASRFKVAEAVWKTAKDDAYRAAAARYNNRGPVEFTNSLWSTGSDA